MRGGACRRAPFYHKLEIFELAVLTNVPTRSILPQTVTCLQCLISFAGMRSLLTGPGVCSHACRLVPCRGTLSCSTRLCSRDSLSQTYAEHVHNCIDCVRPKIPKNTTTKSRENNVHLGSQIRTLRFQNPMKHETCRSTPSTSSNQTIVGADRDTTLILHTIRDECERGEGGSGGRHGKRKHNL